MLLERNRPRIGYNYIDRHGLDDSSSDGNAISALLSDFVEADVFDYSTVSTDLITSTTLPSGNKVTENSDVERCRYFKDLSTRISRDGYRPLLEERIRLRGAAGAWAAAAATWPIDRGRYAFWEHLWQHLELPLSLCQSIYIIDEGCLTLECEVAALQEWF